MFPQPGLCSYFHPDLPPKQVLELIIRSGFKAISIWGADGPGIDPMTDSLKQLIRAVRNTHNLILESLHAPYQVTPDLYSLDESARTNAIDRLRMALDDAAELEIPIVVIHAHRTGDPDELSAIAQRSFTELIDSLGSASPRLAVENTPGSILTLEWALNEFPAAKLGFCYDSGHDHMAAGETFDLLRRWGHRLLSTHIADNLGQTDDHLIPGQGTLDWTAFVRAFPWQSYKGYLTLEPMMGNSRFTDPAEFLAQSLAAANRLLTLARQAAGE